MTFIRCTAVKSVWYVNYSQLGRGILTNGIGSTWMVTPYMYATEFYITLLDNIKRKKCISQINK